MQRSRLPRFFVVGAAAVATLLVSSAPAMADASTWKVGYYTPSGRALSLANANPGSGIASLDFTDQPNTALPVTTHGAGQDLRGQTITAKFDITGVTGAFTYFGEPDGSGAPATTRFFFQTDNGGGFAYTNYWWTNPESAVLANGTFTLTAKVEPAEWSDWNGQPGASQTPGFLDAASNVTTIGFSSGGGYFFENGVGTTDGSRTFTLDSWSIG